MIDLKRLRDEPEYYKRGAERKRMAVDIERVLELDSARRALTQESEGLKAEQNKLAKETGPKIGQLMGRLKKAGDDERAAIQAEIDGVKAGPATLKARIQELEAKAAEMSPELDAMLLEIPQPADEDVPDGAGAEDNIEIGRWAPEGWDWSKSFEDNRGFAPKTHLELCESLGLVDFPRGVKLAGSRSYVLTGLGMRLHQAVLRYAIDRMVDRNGFTPMSVPVIVRENAMEGTGFFPHGRDQAYLIEESKRGGGHDLYLTGTGEVELAACGIYALIPDKLAALNSWPHVIALGFLLAVLAVIGDLAESVVKRSLHAKDSGSMLPGIGGGLDLIDSICFTAPALYFYLVWLLPYLT
ncbi:MAG: phosphatidate cytidylyltransferase [Planctomycetota bacterium]